MRITFVPCGTECNEGRLYVLFPHSMLYQMALKRKLWFGKNIKMSNYMYDICEQEMKSICKFEYIGPIAEVIIRPIHKSDDDILAMGRGISLIVGKHE